MEWRMHCTAMAHALWNMSEEFERDVAANRDRRREVLELALVSFLTLFL